MHRARRLLILLATSAAGACATTRASGPAAIARLERQRAANGRSEPVLRALGIAYYKSGRLPDARSALEQAVKLEPRDGTASLFLGLTAEAQNDLVAARSAYGSYIQYGRTSRVRRQLEGRLAALQRKALEQTALAQIRQEQQLSGVAGTPNVIAVMPLRFSGPDTSLLPLERGFAELLTVDLARSSRLTVVERLRIQAVIDELKRQQSGITDSSTNVRAGRILQAGRMVQGAILQRGQQLRVDAAVIDVPSTRVAGAANDDRALDELLTLEKNIALGLFTQLGVTLTTAERNAVEQRPTRSLAAFLAYSRGLLREDEGRFDEADRFFQDAVRVDPGFSAARQKGQETQRIIAGNQVSAQTIQGSLSGTAEGRIVDQATEGVVTGSVGAAMAAVGDINPSIAGAAATNAAGALTSPPLRDPVGAGTGIENPSPRTAVIEIVVRRP